MAKVTTRQIQMLAPYLEGENPTHTNTDRETGEQTREWNLSCPLHEDGRRSASINLDKGLFYCQAGCGGMSIVSLIRRQSEWVDPQLASQNGHGKHLDANSSAPNKKHRQITDAMISGYHSALMSNASALQWLLERRGINQETAIAYQLGMQDGKLYTIPVRDEAGDLVNIRYYDPNPGNERRKIFSESGYGSPPRLYPISIVNSDLDDIIIAAGEMDTLLALQAGFFAITRTAGENQWDMSWGPWFKDKRVYICQDSDDEGISGNKKIARALEKVAREVRVIELPYPKVKKHGKDITDLLLDFGPEKMRELMTAAPLWGKKDRGDELETVTVLDTFDAHRVGEHVRVIVTIKGRKEPGYTVPRKIHLACTQDAGTKCQGCPLNAVNGEADMDVTPDDPLVLSFMESPSHLMHQAIAEAYGVPGGRCGRLQQEIEEHQAIEVLFGRPALDYADGSSEEARTDNFKNITLTSVGRHNTMSNNTVAAVGALQPSPKSQRNEFLVHELENLETSVDRFELNDHTIKLMKRFQPSAKQRPIKKIAEISKAMAEHVTRIHGRPEMHALMDLTFHGVLGWKFAGESINRGWLESLIIGDTRTGKSLAAERLVRHYGGGEIISCEAASFAGVVGGVQQLGGKDWAVTWGVVPINDRRLVVLDEISGLTPEEIAQMSDIRSSGQAKLIKVVQETTWARTRLLWLGNPRNSTMANYTYGVDAIKPLIGNAEDIARFDLAMAVTLFDVPAEIINRPAAGGELKYTSEACHALLMWVWTRQPDQVIWADGSEGKVFDCANEMGKLYIEDPPLVQGANIRIKIARLAIAIAARTFSTDASNENVLVLPEHVEDAMMFMNLLYGMQAFGYRERSRERLSDRYEAEKNKDKIEQYLKGRPLLAKHLRSAGKFRRQDLEELLNSSREEANGIINTLFEARMVRRVLGDIYVEPTLHELLRTVKW